jgi:predicted DNA binding protein
MGKKFKALQLDIFHQGCFASLLTERFPEVSMRSISTVKLLKAGKKLNGYQVAVEIIAPDRKLLDCFIESLKNFKKVKGVDLWAKAATRAFALLTIESKTSSYDEVLKQGAIPINPVRMAHGYDIHSIVTTNFKDIKSILNSLEEIGEVKVTKIGSIDSSLNDSLLTEKQTDALRKAISFGYYSWPRQATLEELAKESSLSRRAYQEHLRKAESKIIPDLLKEYLVTRASA